MPFIAVEGMDGAGKSTLADALEAEVLRREPSATVIRLHRSRPVPPTRRQVLDDYVLSLEREEPRDAGHWRIADRWHCGEAVYAGVKRPETDSNGFGLLGRSGWRWTEMFLRSRGAHLVWIKVSLELARRRIGVRGDDYVLDHELEALHAGYQRVMLDSVVTTSLVRGDELDTRRLAEDLVNFTTSVDRRSAHLRPFPEYVGSPGPRVLLVGDELNLNQLEASETALPFMPVNGNSGTWLLDALPEGFWPLVGLVNGNHPGLDLAALHEALGRPSVVALGRNAGSACDAAGVRAATVPHPQWARRFKHGDQAGYGRSIVDAALHEREEVATWTS